MGDISVSGDTYSVHDKPVKLSPEARKQIESIAVAAVSRIVVEACESVSTQIANSLGNTCALQHHATMSVISQLGDPESQEAPTQ